MKVLREGPLARLLPQEEATSPASVVLAALAGECALCWDIAHHWDCRWRGRGHGRSLLDRDVMWRQRAPLHPPACHG